MTVKKPWEVSRYLGNWTYLGDWAYMGKLSGNYSAHTLGVTSEARFIGNTLCLVNKDMLSFHFILSNKNTYKTKICTPNILSSSPCTVSPGFETSAACFLAVSAVVCFFSCCLLFCLLPQFSEHSGPSPTRRHCL